MSRRLFLAVAILAAGVLVWRWVSGWGLITVNFVDAPLSKVVAAVQRQGGVRIVSNADPSTPVTLQVRSAPLFEALDLLAVRLDGEMSLLYIVAPSRTALEAGLAAAATGERRPVGWTFFGGGWGRGGGPGGGGGFAGASAPDLRKISLKPSPSEDKSLQAFFQQASIKTGALFAAPSDWNPALGALPGSGSLAAVVHRVAALVKGKVQEAVLLRVRPQREDFARGGDRTPGSNDSPPRGDGNRPGNTPREQGAWRERPQINPEWIAERAEAQIALLPKEEQAQAREGLDEMRKLWAEIRRLPPEERRAKFEEVMSRPDVQERLQERMAARSDKRSPAQRAQRYRRYVERKKAAAQAQP